MTGRDHGGVSVTQGADVGQRPKAVIVAALAYLALIFALGFALGVVRTLWLAPLIGAAPAVLVELAPMLLASWLAVRRIIRRWALTRSECAVMGALAFAGLLALECVLALALGGSVRGWAVSLATLPGALGLAGQAAFGVMPVLVRKAPGN